MSVRSADGVPIEFRVYRGPGAGNAVIVCHGFFKSKETRVFDRMSRALAIRHDVLTMDFRGHGRSGGLYTFSAREGADLEAVLAWARSRYAHLGVLGFSLGGAIAINTICRSPAGVRSLITVSAPAGFREIEFKWWTPEAIRRGIRGLRPGAGCRPGNLWLKKERPVDNMAALRVPVLFVHGTRDMIVDARHSRRLFEAAPEPKRLEIIKGGSHAEGLFQDDPEGFTRLIERWWTETLPTS